MLQKNPPVLPFGRISVDIHLLASAICECQRPTRSGRLPRWCRELLHQDYYTNQIPAAAISTVDFFSQRDMSTPPARDRTLSDGNFHLCLYYYVSQRGDKKKGPPDEQEDQQTTTEYKSQISTAAAAAGRGRTAAAGPPLVWRLGNGAC